MILFPLFFDIETTGLNPFEHRISAIGVSDGENIDVIDSFMEKDAIRKLFEMVDDDVVLVGFNIKGFDIPFITTRCILSGVEDYTKLHECKKVDLMLVVRSYMLTQRVKHNLTWLHSTLTGKEFTDLTGAEIALKSEDYLAGKVSFDDIKEHSTMDIIRTVDVFKRLEKLCAMRFERKYGFKPRFELGWW